MRKQFSLSSGVKALLTPEGREILCRVLLPHVNEALSRWPDNPLRVRVGEDHYLLYESLETPGKVRVSV